MAATLPAFTRTIDDAFVTTWYDIKPAAIDNILNATVVMAALKSFGCMDEQTGGNIITETIKYDYGDAAATGEGQVFTAGDKETETMAIWTWRYMVAGMKRSIFQDQQNQGKYKIKSYVEKKMQDARNGLVQAYESKFLATPVTAETGLELQGLNDMVPQYDGSTYYQTGTYGKIARPTTWSTDASDSTIKVPTVGNTWWAPKYVQLTTPYEVNLLDDMKKIYNVIGNNQEFPNFILTTRAMYELYESFALDQAQIVKPEKGGIADLGFDVCYFKGKQMSWSSNMTANNFLFLNTNYIKVKYDPTMYFDMTEWKQIPNQGDRVAHILCAMNVISNQLRRHGRLYA